MFGMLPVDLKEKIKTSRILVVGVGGIGCEILKNLVMCHFPSIEIIDMDTIELSNLNRQFLFHREHIGQPKALVAKCSALEINPNVKIAAHQDSILSTEYGVNYFKKFTMVLSALDNRQARNHVNRMCLNADVPLIESGTAGFNGQVELIVKGVTQCYECLPKPAPKTYPGCTIRNTPSELIHCVVWAKYLFNQLFGESIAEEEVSPDFEDPEVRNGTEEIEDDGNIRRINTRQWAVDLNYDVKALFTKLFHDDINYLLSMEDLWKTRKPPVPIKWDEVYTNEYDNLDYTRQYFNMWDLKLCVKVFRDTVINLRDQIKKKTDDPTLIWDKDDQNAMDFVAAVTNIRAHIFSIPPNTRFELKSMAGNIIPAVASTNAITAGLVLIKVFQILRNQINDCVSIYVRINPNSRNQLLAPDRTLLPPNPNCYVCAKEPAVFLRVDTNRLKIIELRDKILKNELNMLNPDVMVETTGSIIISSDEDETASNERKTLKDMKIVDGVILQADDFHQRYTLRLIIMHIDIRGRDQALYEIAANKEQIKTKEELTNQAQEPTVEQEEESVEDYMPPFKKRHVDKSSEENDTSCTIDLSTENDDTITKKDSENDSEMKTDGENGKEEDDDGDEELILIESSDDENIDCEQNTNTTETATKESVKHAGLKRKCDDSSTMINVKNHLHKVCPRI